MSSASPDPELRAVVVVPARDEAERIGGCLRALGKQRGVDPSAFEVIVVLDHCDDDTGLEAQRIGRELPGFGLVLLESELPGAGHARKLGMDYACERLLEAGCPDGLIVSTDADTRVADDWLAVQLALAGEGARAIGGRIDLDPLEASALLPAVHDERAVRTRHRLARVPRQDVTKHHHFSGASLALTARTYAQVGGLPATAALEDEALERALEDHGIPIVRSDRVQVVTSARTDGRAPRGLARDLQLSDWRARRSFRADQFDVEHLIERKTSSVSVILPAREVASTIGPIVATVTELRDRGLVDEVLVVDAASRDGTASVAADYGAAVLQEDELLSEHGPARGKGDAMWRALSAANGEVIAYLDADTRDFSPDFVVGLLGPLLTDQRISFVKGAFRRPLTLDDGRVLMGEGGRVTELVARPLLNLYAPHLAGFDQPLAGEMAARADLLRRLRFPAGYGVEIANLIDAAQAAGIEALAQVDLGQRQNRHQSLRDLSAMSYAVLVAATTRLNGAAPSTVTAPSHLVLPPLEGRTCTETRQVTVAERPALDSLTHGGAPAVLETPSVSA